MSQYDEKRERPRQPRQEDAPRPRKKRRRRSMGGWGALMYVMLVIGASVLLASLGWMLAGDVLALNKPALEAQVTVSDGESVAEVTKELKEKGLIDNSFLFKFFADFTKKGAEILPGTYTLDTTMDYSAILRNLSAKSGARAEVTVVIREGYTSTQVFQALAEHNVATVAELEEAAASYDYKFSFLKDVVPLGDKNRLEGYLFPDTYNFYENMDPVQALNKMLLRFDAVFTQEMRDQVAANGQTLHQLLTIASLIEKETTGDDQTHISSVIYNRLNNPNSETAGFLNIDASLLYVLPERAGKLNAADLEYDSPYNTKKYKGLPPGPIANPGQSAIRAAMKPDDSKDYFYALGDDNEHHFFKTYNEHVNFVNSQERYK